MRLVVLLLIAAASAGCGNPIRSFGPADLWPHGVVAESTNTFNPIRPFGSVVIASEEIIVTADDPLLHYPNGETVSVDLEEGGSIKVVRTVWKSADGKLSVDYDLPAPPSRSDAP